ncbi:interleukin enhancer-binding factor 3 isoform X2 [Solenopsis invicta]|uniref:interleukin enhancer-binding factor 3 isoform X2 n=1 Tax=Solenopsis invicta TaxID=13686 RepID=UPI000595F5BA|nr:interleukin enhancer-binding factor 3 isoform X2 [Solenopsis invicta]
MYTRSRQSQQNYGNGRNPNNPQSQGSQGSQGSYSMPQQQQQQPAQMSATASARPLPPIPPTQQLKQQQLQQQGQQQKLQQQQQQQQQGQQQKLQLQQQQQQKLLQQQQQQQSPQQQINQQAMQQQAPQQQQQPMPQRLKPILKQSTPIAQPAATVAQSMTSQPPPMPPNSTNNNADMSDDNIKNDMDVDMQDAQPRWRRKIPGFKVNKKLKRLRMNQRLRKTLQPKNAIMVLNEMKAGVQFTFPESQGPMPNSLYLVHAELDGKTYVGQGLSKPLARQNAAENALKALLLEKMTAASMKARLDAESDGQTTNIPMDGIKEDSNDDSSTAMDTATEDEIPWSSLASFALYKLFLEWHNQGTSVPVPRPGLPNAKGVKKDSTLTAAKTPAQKELPPNPTSIHPVMLLNQMRPGLTYTELSRVGNPPNTMFTLAVEIGGVEYSGTAKNKKDAKKAAAKSALLALYNLAYPEDTSKELTAIG